MVDRLYQPVFPRGEGPHGVLIELDRVTEPELIEKLARRRNASPTASIITPAVGIATVTVSVVTTTGGVMIVIVVVTVTVIVIMGTNGVLARPMVVMGELRRQLVGVAEQEKSDQHATQPGAL